SASSTSPSPSSAPRSRLRLRRDGADIAAGSRTAPVFRYPRSRLEIYALCPFRVGTLLWEAQPGELSLTVTVKATFRLVPGGEATVAPEQDELGDDRHWDDDARASLFRPGDLVPLKRRVDVVLVGHAYAPGGAPTRSMTARLRVGEIDKSILVT